MYLLNLISEQGKNLQVGGRKESQKPKQACLFIRDFRVKCPNLKFKSWTDSKLSGLATKAFRLSNGQTKTVAVSFGDNLITSSSTTWEIQSYLLHTMAIRVVEFSRGGGVTKLERFLPKNQYTQRKFLNFENLTNGEPQ